MRYEQSELEAAYEALVKNESQVGVVLGAIVGAVPAAMLYLVFGSMGGIPGFFMLIPAVVIGLFARFTGRPFRIGLRILVGVIAAAVHILGCTILLEIHPLWLLLTPANAGIAIGLSKVSLSRVEEFAVSRAKLGKLGDPAAAKQAARIP